MVYIIDGLMNGWMAGMAWYKQIKGTELISTQKITFFTSASILPKKEAIVCIKPYMHLEQELWLDNRLSFLTTLICVITLRDSLLRKGPTCILVCLLLHIQTFLNDYPVFKLFRLFSFWPAEAETP